MYFIVDVNEMNGYMSIEEVMCDVERSVQVVVTAAFLLLRVRNRVREKLHGVGHARHNGREFFGQLGRQLTIFTVVRTNYICKVHDTEA